MRAWLALVLGCALSWPALAVEGEAFFRKACAGCHKADGTGVPGFGPPLKGGLAPILATGQGAAYVVHVLVGGLRGPIDSMGKRYNGIMPSFASQPDDVLLAVAGHVVGTLNGAAAPGPEVLAATRADPPTPDVNHALRAELLGQGG